MLNKGTLALDLMGYFMMFIKIEHASYNNYCNDDVQERFDGYEDLAIESSGLYNNQVTVISYPHHCDSLLLQQVYAWHCFDISTAN